MPTDPTTTDPAECAPDSSEDSAPPPGPHPELGAPGGTRRRRAGLISGLGLAVLAADVATKTWAVHTLSVRPVSLLDDALVLTEGRNAGAAFGLGTSLTPLLAAVAVAAVITLVAAARRPHRWPVAVALGLALGGAAGNAADRLLRAPGPMRGHVVDWIDVGSWPTFNLADSALMIALACGALIAWRSPADSAAP